MKEHGITFPDDVQTVLQRSEMMVDKIKVVIDEVIEPFEQKPFGVLQATTHWQAWS